VSSKFKGLKILVVDDYENTRKKLVAELHKLEITVSEASNGLEALDVLRAGKFDAIFTDIVMPEMDGFELCEDVRNIPEFCGIPIVVVSTHVDTNYIMKALRVGADDYISKPIEADLVERVISRIMIPLLNKASNARQA
jgi:PleD family two-component response regulator